MIENIQNLNKAELLGFISIIVGMGVFFIGLRTLFFAISSLQWPKTEGKILSTTLNAFKFWGEPRTSYNPIVRYKYILDDKEYLSARVYFGYRIASSFKRRSLKTLKKYNTGDKVNVFYNPEKENMAVIEPGIKFELVFVTVFGLIFILFGGYVLLNIDLFISLTGITLTLNHQM